MNKHKSCLRDALAEVGRKLILFSCLQQHLGNVSEQHRGAVSIPWGTLKRSIASVLNGISIPTRVPFTRQKTLVLLPARELRKPRSNRLYRACISLR